MPRWQVLSLALALAACGGPQQPAAPDVDPEAAPIAHAFFDEVRTGVDIDADPHVAHELKNPTSAEQIAQFRALIPAQPPTSVERRDVEVTSDSVGTTTRLTEVYRYADGQTLVVRTALFKSPAGTSPVIVGFQPEPDAGTGG